MTPVATYDTDLAQQADWSRLSWLVSDAWSGVPEVTSANPDDYEFSFVRRHVEAARQIARFPHKVFVARLSAGNCRLRNPITVTVSQEEGNFIAEYEPLSHYGIGACLSEAILDMFESLCVVYDAYSETPENTMDAGARELLAAHERILERVR